MSYPYRIFISYSHEDGDKAQRVADDLYKLGLTPVWDAHIKPGTPFTEAIKSFIHHAHIFMPIITENSIRRPWVHQETGFAMALNIPILPIAVDSVPGEMVAQLQGVVVRSDFSDFYDRIKALNLDIILEQPSTNTFKNIEVTTYREKRSELLASYARHIMDIGEFGKVSQRAAMSSFSIPDKPVSDPIWDQLKRDVPLSDYFKDLQREERRLLEKHARQKGISLIIDPQFCLERNGPVITRVKTSILKKFLESMPDDKVQIIISTRAREANLTIVGDWFSALSMSPKPGEFHRQTVFSWHPPSVLTSLRQFDEEFSELLHESGLFPSETRKSAISQLESFINTL